jgi:hypothetical protein
MLSIDVRRIIRMWKSGVSVHAVLSPVFSEYFLWAEPKPHINNVLFLYLVNLI